MANKQRKKCSTSLRTREVQIKTTMRYCYYLPMKTAKIKNSYNTKGWRGYGKTGSFRHCG